MSSFYGNGFIVTGGIDEGKIVELKNHVIVSKTQPTSQKEGDIWFVVTDVPLGENEGTETGQG